MTGRDMRRRLMLWERDIRPAWTRRDHRWMTPEMLVRAEIRGAIQFAGRNAEGQSTYRLAHNPIMEMTQPPVAPRGT